MAADKELAFFLWGAAGIVLLISELFIPGLVAAFFGLGALFLAAFTYFGWVSSIPMQFLLWGFLSFFLLLTLRGQVKKYFPSLERYDPVHEEKEVIGSRVEVVEDVHTTTSDGRVRFQGTTWMAVSLERDIMAGEQAVITGRDKLLLYIRPIDSKNL